MSQPIKLSKETIRELQLKELESLRVFKEFCQKMRRFRHQHETFRCQRNVTCLETAYISLLGCIAAIGIASYTEPMD